MSKYQLETEYIDVHIKGLNPNLKGFKIAHLSDIHIPCQKDRLENVYKFLLAEKPDMIAVTGDTVTANQNIHNVGFDRLCRKLSAIAVTYIVAGNHECRGGFARDLYQIAEQNHCIPLSDSRKTLNIDSGRLAIMGTADRKELDMSPLKDNSISDTTRIFLCHRPHSLRQYNSLEKDVRPHLVLSGHAHGGQIRLPFIGGILAPDQGFFPRLTSGLYKYNDMQMVVSRGIGDSTFPFRLMNPPHLPIITLKQ